MNSMQIPAHVEQIIHTLNSHGYEAFAVGGCVRDTLLGRKPGDWDITTSARPEQVKALFRRTIDTGIQHGTVTIMMDRTGYEVTTYRIDGEYEDGRHPKQVEFTSDLLEDLRRRDFTINAMAYSHATGIVDAFDGVADLKARRIRCVGNAMERFTEDALRILRAIRFSAQLDFEIEAETKAALAEFAPRLTKVSAERIQVELMKLLTSDHPEVFRVVWETGITAVILPEFDACMETPQHNPHHCWNVGEHILQTLTGVEKDKALRWAALLHDMGKPATRTTDEQGIDHFHGHAKLGAEMANGILRRLKFDNDTRKRVVRLVEFHDDRQFPLNHRGVRRAIHRIGADLFPDYLKLARADALAQNPALLPEKLARLSEIERLYTEILEAQNCLSLKDLAVTGRDLIDAGVKPGPTLGVILNAMLEAVIEHPEYNTKEYLLERILPLVSS